MAERHTIPARKGLALRVSKGQRYKVLRKSSRIRDDQPDGIDRETNV